MLTYDPPLRDSILTARRKEGARQGEAQGLATKKPARKNGRANRRYELGQLELQPHLGVGNTQRTQLQIDACAGLGIGASVMMIQRDAKIGAHAAEFFGGKRQTAPGAFKRAQKRRTRFALACSLTAGGQHAPVKRGIVCKQMCRPFKKGLHLWPHFGKCRRVFKHGPSQAVDLCKHYPRRRRPDKAVKNIGHPALLNTSKAHGASAVGRVA